MSEQKETTMREIKFRAWWLDHCSAFENGEYIKSWKLSPVHSIHFNKGIAMLTGGMVKSVRSIPIDEECILEQFTGLCDKNGREIYEGDILTRRVFDYLGNEYSRAGVVQYARGIFGVNWDYSKNKDPEWSDGGMYGGWGKRHNLRSLDDDLIEALEIIGNIHENPELLV